MRIIHENNGDCKKCDEIFNKYPDFYQPIRDWFKITIQAKHPTAHISCAGRGKADQDRCVREGKSRARWKQSAHNYNLAIDIFFLILGKADYSKSHYKAIEDNLHDWLNWYGSPGSSYYELPHVEARGWKTLVANGRAKLVE